MKQNSLLRSFSYELLMVLLTASCAVFAAEIPEISHEAVPVLTSAGQKSLEQLVNVATDEMNDFFWTAYRSEIADKATKEMLQQAYRNFHAYKKLFEQSADSKTKEMKLAQMNEIIRQVKAIYDDVREKEKINKRKKELIGKFNTVESEATKLIDTLDVDKTSKQEFKIELENLRGTFFRYLFTTQAQLILRMSLEESTEILGQMEDEIKKADHFFERLAAMKQAQERRDVSKAVQKTEGQEEFDSLIKKLERDIKKYTESENPILTWHAEPWEKCVNAPVNLRLQLAAQIAFDVKKNFMGKEVLNIASFAAGGYGGKGVQLLQEFTILDAIYYTWPEAKKLQINLFLIGPDLDQLQISLLQKEADDQLVKINAEHGNVSRINLSLVTFKTHTDYINKSGQEPNLKADILFVVDYSQFEPATEQSANGLHISNGNTSLDLVFVDLKPKEPIKDSLRTYYMPGAQLPKMTKGLVLTLLNKQLGLQDFNSFFQSLPSTTSLNRTPLLIEFVIEHLKQFGYEFWSQEKKPRLTVNRFVYMPLAFKEIIVNTFKPGQLIYSLQQRILLPADYDYFMLSPLFYLDPGIMLEEREQFYQFFPTTIVPQS